MKHKILLSLLLFSCLSYLYPNKNNNIKTTELNSTTYDTFLEEDFASYKYHKVIKIGSTAEEAKANFCYDQGADKTSWKLNIFTDQPLDKTKIYRMNFGRGLHYYKLLIAATFKGDSDYDINENIVSTPLSPNCNGDDDNDGVQNFRDLCRYEGGTLSNRGCPVIGSKKYHKVIYVGATSSATNYSICSGTTPNSSNTKLNITIANPLIKGKVYRMNFGEGFNYYKVLLASQSSGDGDYLIPGNVIGTPFDAFCDNDHDGIENSQDNCPNNHNPNQADLDNDGIGNACDNTDNRDFDNDGVDNYQDDCPNEAGPASNNGCPVAGTPDLQFEGLNKSDFRSDCYAPGTGCVVGGHYIYKSVFSNGMDFKVSLKNQGEATSETVYIHVYLWANDDPNVAFYKPKNNVFKLSPLNPGQSRPFISFFFNDSAAYFNGDLPAGNYTLQVRVEKTLAGNSEYSSDITLPFQVRAGDPPSRRGGGRTLFNAFKSNELLNNSLYTIKVYNVQGIQIAKKTMTTKEEENDLIKSLPKGFYIIQNGDRTYKIVK